MPQGWKAKKDRVRVTIERRNGQLVRVTTIMHRKQRDWEERVEPYNPLPVAPVASIWSAIIR